MDHIIEGGVRLVDSTTNELLFVYSLEAGISNSDIKELPLYKYNGIIIILF